MPSAGNLDERGTGDIHTLTVREYRALPWLRRAPNTGSIVIPS